MVGPALGAPLAHKQIYRDFESAVIGFWCLAFSIRLQKMVDSDPGLWLSWSACLLFYP